jgi:hypothetical protein
MLGRPHLSKYARLREAQSSLTKSSSTSTVSLKLPVREVGCQGSNMIGHIRR